MKLTLNSINIVYSMKPLGFYTVKKSKLAYSQIFTLTDFQ